MSHRLWYKYFKIIDSVSVLLFDMYVANAVDDVDLSLFLC